MKTAGDIILHAAGNIRMLGGEILPMLFQPLAVGPVDILPAIVESRPAYISPPSR